MAPRRRLERPLVRDAVEAWPYGPILPVLYQEFKQFGDGPITGRAFEFDFERGENRNLTADLPVATSHLLEVAWESYRDEPGPDLNALASAPGSPWDEVIRDRNGAPAARRTAIPNDHLRRYYDERRRRILAGEA